MRQTTSDRSGGIQWALEDLEFADDLAVIRLYSSPRKVRPAKQLYKISWCAHWQEKSHVMYINAPTVPLITISGEAVECLEISQIMTSHILEV